MKTVTSAKDVVAELVGASNESGARSLAVLRAQADSSRALRVDRAALRLAGLLPEEARERHLIDQFRTIKRPIMQRLKSMAATSQPSDVAQSLLVTSALPRDGKTFTCINLALSVARERDASALLIDADVATPNISRVFGVEQEPGLLDALFDESIDVEKLVRPTDLAGLFVLPVGNEREQSTELLSSARMKAVMARMSALDPRRLLLFDSAPLLMSNDARSIAQMVKQVVLVVRSGITPQNAVKDAIATIEREKLTGVVLNQNDLRSFNRQYGYGTYGVD